MSEEPAVPISPPPAKSFSWLDVWMNALAFPSVATFEEIVNDPKATIERACIWVLLATVISQVISIFAPLALAKMLGSASSGASTSIIATSLDSIGFPAALSVVLLLIVARIDQIIENGLGGDGTYLKAVYAFGAYLAPLILIEGVLRSIPIINPLFLILFLIAYGLVLNVIAVKAVHHIGWGKAIIPSMTLMVIAGVMAKMIEVVIIASLPLLVFLDKLANSSW